MASAVGTTPSQNMAPSAIQPGCGTSKPSLTTATGNITTAAIAVTPSALVSGGVGGIWRATMALTA